MRTKETERLPSGYSYFFCVCCHDGFAGYLKSCVHFRTANCATIWPMAVVTQLLEDVVQGDGQDDSALLLIVYSELRQLAAARLAQEKPGQTLQPTALVHEAYLRLVGEDGGPAWKGQAHFFGAAAEAIRRILIENARRKGRLKHGGQMERRDLEITSP